MYTQAPALALAVLGWILSDTLRADRFLAVTGLTPDVLRESLDSRETQAAVLEFLCAHEPDLVAAAESLELQPATLAAALQELQR